MSTLHELKARGQSVWLDHIDHDLIHSGELKKWVDEDEICGVTPNPGILASEEMRAFLGGGHTPATASEKVVIADIQAAADILRPVYEKTHRREGYVSLQVSPALADDTEKAVAEARRLWHEVGRENLLIEIPATESGLPAITQLIADGINVNATLLFSQALYQRAAQAYLDGLEQLIARGGVARAAQAYQEGMGKRRARGGNPANGASVESLFLSRIDTAVDAIITSLLNQCGWIKIYNAVERESLRNLLGKVAIANARVAYERYQAIFSGARWDALAAQGARKQRLLWASTAIENPAYRDVKYIEELIGPDTVTTIPPVTLALFRDHGRVRDSLQENTANSAILLSTLKTLRIPLDDIASRLLSEGSKPFTTV